MRNPNRFRGSYVVTPTSQKVETLGEFHLLPPEAKCLYCGPYEEETFVDHAATPIHNDRMHHAKFHPPGLIEDCTVKGCRFAVRSAENSARALAKLEEGSSI